MLISTAQKFEPPTLESVTIHASEIGLPESEAEKFWFFYDSKSWCVGKSKMKKWKSSMALWFLNWKQKQPAANAPQTLMNLNTILKAKQVLAIDLKNRWSSEVATGREWCNETKRQEFVKLRKEIGELTLQISNHHTTPDRRTFLAK